MDFQIRTEDGSLDRLKATLVILGCTNKELDYAEMFVEWKN